MVRAGYKETEVGVIPDDWEVDKISKHASITTGSRNTQDRITEGIYPFFVRSQIVENLDTYSFDGEAVLTAGDGVGTGKIFHYINGKFDFHQRVYKISNFKPDLDGYYFYKYFSNHFYDRIMSMTAKSSVDSVRMEMIADMLIPLPDPDEQRAIAEALSDVDALIAALDKLIAKKRAIKTAAIQQLLTGKTRLPGFGKQWAERSLGELINYERPDKYIVKNTEYSDYGDTPVLTANKSFVLGYTNESFGIFWDFPIILFDDFTTDCKFVDFPFKVKSSAIKILSQKVDEVNLRYIFERIQLIQFPIGDHKRYYISEYQNIKFKIPEFEEQNTIARILSNMVVEIAALETRRDKTYAIKQAMMQELLTGKTRLLD